MRFSSIAALLSAACGTTAVCGNGQVEPGEQCDDGNLIDGDGCSSTCRSTPTIDTFLHWTMVAQEFPGFDGEKCDDLGATEVEIDLSGPKSLTLRNACDLGQVKLSSLPHGQYTITGTLLDASGAALTKGQARANFVQGDSSEDLTLDFPFSDFSGSYQGTFFFKISWGGMDSCAGARVAKVRLTMTRGGTAVAGMVQDDGTPLDGSAPGPCHDATEQFAQAAKNVAWGPAKLAITGEDAAGHVLYRGSFDTYVGAGIFNPRLVFDVPGLGADAGVGGTDAAPADARTVDAGG